MREWIAFEVAARVVTEDEETGVKGGGKNSAYFEDTSDERWCEFVAAFLHSARHIYVAGLAS